LLIFSLSASKQKLKDIKAAKYSFIYQFIHSTILPLDAAQSIKPKASLPSLRIKHFLYPGENTQGDQKVSVHLTIVLQSSGARRLFDRPVRQINLGLKQLRDVVNQALSHIPLTAAPTITVLHTRAKYDIYGRYFFCAQCSER